MEKWFVKRLKTIIIILYSGIHPYLLFFPPSKISFHYYRRISVIRVLQITTFIKSAFSVFLFLTFHKLLAIVCTHTKLFNSMIGIAKEWMVA